jgi:cyclophilin family peptidyl-prolyl cis-trans isomerase/HEAT repeat protein
MKITFYTVFIFIFVFVSCAKYNEKRVLEDLRKLEHTRNSDTSKFPSWLNDKNALIRRKAVETLGKIQDTTTVVLIANRLNDDDISVREAAAFALGQLYSHLCEDYLLEAVQLDRTESVRIKLAEALGKCGTLKSSSILKDYLESDNRNYEKIASLACGIMAYRGNPLYENTFPLELLLNTSKNPEVRWHAAYGLYRIGTPSSLINVFREIKNPDNPLIRYYVVKTISGIISVMQSEEFREYKNHPSMIKGVRLANSSEFFDIIAKMLGDESWFVRVADIQLINILKKSFYRDEILTATKDSHPYVKIEAIRTLKNYGNRAVQQELRRIYSSNEDWRIQGEALAVLSELNPSMVIDFIEKDFAETEWPKDYYAIKALGTIRDEKNREKSTSMLINIVNNFKGAKVVLALEALVDRPEVPIDLFLKQLEKGDPAITTIAATHLAYRKDARSVEPLIDAYKNFSAPRDVETMEAIIVALDSIRSPRAAPFLRDELKNPYATIRQKARRALENISSIKIDALPEVENASRVKWDFVPIDPDLKPKVRINTSAGSITIELYPERAPVTVANFLSLAQSGFYDKIFFHRVVPGFVIQTGDPRGDGWGGPGYSIPCDYNDTPFERGTVGMAHAGKDTGGSQFFITQIPQPHLAGRYTGFGKVLDGMGVVDTIMLFDFIINIEILSELTAAHQN